MRTSQRDSFRNHHHQQDTLSSLYQRRMGSYSFMSTTKNSMISPSKTATLCCALMRSWTTLMALNSTPNLTCKGSTTSSESHKERNRKLHSAPKWDFMSTW